MKARIFKIIYNPLFSGSMIMILGSNAINFFNYIYHFIIGRLLAPAQYGELAALFSLVSLISMIPTSFGLVIIKFISASKNKNETDSLINWMEQKIWILAVFLVFIVLIFSSFFANFLNLKNSFPIIVISFTFVFGLPSFFYRSVLQGLLKFKENIFSSIAESLLKLLLGVSLVYLGFSVSGALYGLILAALAGLIIARFYVKDHLAKKEKLKINIMPLLIFYVPVFIQTISYTSMSSADLILVKHFFHAQEAGIYAAISNLGRIILFGTGPITAVMFPMISQKSSRGENAHKIFIYSFLLTVLIAALILALYWFFPDLAIKSLYGSSYLNAAHYLFWFGVFMFLFTMSSLLISYYLSLGITKIVIFPLLASVAQIFGIWFYHNDLNMVISVSVIVSALLFICLFCYLFRLYLKSDSKLVY